MGLPWPPLIKDGCVSEMKVGIACMLVMEPLRPFEAVSHSRALELTLKVMDGA